VTAKQKEQTIRHGQNKQSRTRSRGDGFAVFLNWRRNKNCQRNATKVEIFVDNTWNWEWQWQWQ
jgi:hypothetical protein